MNNKNNKGFTLIELLAVTIILIVVLILAVNAVDERSKKAKKDAVKASAISYYKAARSLAETSTGVDTPFSNANYSTTELKDLGVEISGKKPSTGFIYYENNKMICGCLSYGKYKVEYKNDDYSSVKKGSCNKRSVNCEQYLTVEVHDFDYTGDSQEFVITYNATAKLEVWGAQGGTINSTYFGGYGGYSVGYLNVAAGSTLYVQVGQTGIKNSTVGTYNGGGAGTVDDGASGGGATSISNVAGEIKNVTPENLIIVAGGGGAGCLWSTGWASGAGGHGGGYIGGAGTIDGWAVDSAQGGTQTEGGRYGLTDSGGRSGNVGSYGQGATAQGYSNHAAGGGGGYYGGGSARHSGAGGGSGYIANPNLTSKAMYCYNCTGDDNLENEVKTYNIDCVNDSAISKCAKKGNGYARITLYKSVANDDDYDE